MPAAGEQFARYGGRTTCVQILSECLPPDTILAVDAGTGIDLLGKQALTTGVKEVHILFSHWHHDHTQGLLLCPPIFRDDFTFYLYGPEEHGFSPFKVYETLMQPPIFPVHFVQRRHHFRQRSIRYPEAQAIVVHPTGGFKLLDVDELALAEEKDPPQVQIGKGKYPVEECLVIRMIRGNHPDRSISYRFEERPTGRVFVFMTDHENTDGISQDMHRHLQGASVLAVDAQYPQHIYDKFTAGFGHSTPGYCVRLAASVDCRVLGLTHHDPFAADEDVDHILQEAQVAAGNQGYHGEIRALADNDEIEI
jgi:phosphoribosyl 1,2-cyclic phosphodiesterase